MIDTGDKNFNLNININIKNIRTRYQYQYQYCRIQNSISISIPIPKMIKFKLNLKTIPRYLDILRSQANTQKIRASIAQLCNRHNKTMPMLVLYGGILSYTCHSEISYYVEKKALL